MKRTSLHDLLFFEKSFDLKNEPNVGFTLEFSLVVAKHKWERFIQQKEEIYPNLVRKFHKHLVKKDSHFLMIRGVCVRLDEGYINSMFDLVCVDDGHEQFINSMTTAKRNKILADLCEPSTTWMVSAKGSRSVKRVALKSQAQARNHFLKASLMPTTHNDNVSKERWSCCILSSWDDKLMLAESLLRRPSSALKRVATIFSFIC
ncbi:hypothetical protein V6N12_007578 [Hibiscus sabdariffa]|uniref:Putative plant transposon protein domain-containing protein n=1 Tax=Hibiscus sabdariffa TaxID=183260 RepID=A0ABR2F265_9ROSI